MDAFIHSSPTTRSIPASQRQHHVESAASLHAIRLERLVVRPDAHGVHSENVKANSARRSHGRTYNCFPL